MRYVFKALVRWRIGYLFLLQREHLDLYAPVLLVVIDVAGVSHSRQRIIPTVANHFELVRIEFVLVQDSLAHRVGTIIGKLAHEVAGYNPLTAGVSVALDYDVGVA